MGVPASNGTAPGEPRRSTDEARAWASGSTSAASSTTAPRPDEAGRVTGMDQADQGDEPPPATDTLVHGVRIERRVLRQPGVQAANRIAGVVDPPGIVVASGRQQAAVLGVEDEDQPHQHGQQALVEVAGLLTGELSN